MNALCYHAGRNTASPNALRLTAGLPRLACPATLLSRLVCVIMCVRVYQYQAFRQTQMGRAQLVLVRPKDLSNTRQPTKRDRVRSACKRVSGIWSYALPRIGVEGGNFLERSVSRMSYRLNGLPAGRKCSSESSYKSIQTYVTRKRQGKE